MVRERRWLVATTLLAMLGAFLFGDVASAAEPGTSASFSLKPVTFNPDNPRGESYFILTAWPGETIETNVMVTNTGGAAGVAHLYAVDATTGQTGGVVYQQKHVAPEHVGTWVALDESEVALAPGEEREVTFRLAVPEGIRAGHHLGAIVVVSGAGAEAGPVTTNDETVASVEIKMETRMAVGVQVTIPGAKVAEMRIDGVAPGGSDGYQALNIGLQNTGNTMLKPRGEVRVRNDAGATVQDLAFQLDTFLPDSAIDYAVYIEGEALGVGSYEASVTLHYGDGQKASYTQPFTIEKADIESVFEGRAPLTAPGMGPGGDGPTFGAVWLSMLGLGVLLVGGFGVLAGRRFTGRNAAIAPQPVLLREIDSDEQFVRRLRGQHTARKQ